MQTHNHSIFRSNRVIPFRVVLPRPPPITFSNPYLALLSFPPALSQARQACVDKFL